MIRQVYLLSLVGLVGYSFEVRANEYPLEFADFFEQRTEKIEVIVEGLSRSEHIVADVSYDLFQLKTSEDSSELLQRFLERQSLTTQAASKIVAQLKSGVPANPDCADSLLACIPNDVPNQAEFVFDYDSKLLRIFVSTDMFENYSGEKEYYSPFSAHNALVNWSNLYAYASDDAQTVSWLNETVLGLPAGYVSLDTQYQRANDEQEFDVYRAIYNYEQDEYRLFVGYQDSNSVQLNSTDFLNYGADYSGVSATIGTSTNLLKGDVKAQQRLNFFATQGGQLEVYQGERLLLTKVVGAGEQSIGYDQLPSGSYTVTLRLKQGSEVVLEERRQIVNSSSFALPVGEWDYRVDVGRLDDEHDEVISELSQDSLADRNYLRALASYRPTESALVGSGLVSNGANAQWLLGTKVELFDRASLQYSIGLFGSGDVYHFGQLDVAPFTFSVRNLEHDNLNNPDELTQLLYGADNLNEYSAGVFGQLLGGRAYLNYFHYESEGQNFASSNDNVSVSWTHPLWGGDFSANASYQKSDEGRESFNSGLSWNRRFGGSMFGRVGLNFDDDGFAYSQADVSYLHQGDDWGSTTRVGVKHYNDSNAIMEGSASVYGTSDYVRYDAYGFVDTSGSRSISGNLSGSQMWSPKGGVAATSRRGQAFIELDPKWAQVSDEVDMDKEVNYTALRNNQYWYDEMMPVGQRQLIDLPVYSQVDFALDVESENIDAPRLDGEFFVMPGTYYRMSNEIIPLKSQVFILNDMNGEPIAHARCIGDGCKSVETLSDDGVFRVNFRSNAPFKLVSNKRLCVYNPDLMGDRYIQAYCLPGLEDADGQLVREDDSPVIAQVKGSEALIYIGKYESTEETKRILSRLTEVGLTSKFIEVGDVQYVYVQYQKTYSTAQRTLLESLDAYVILDSIDTKQLFTTR